MSTTILISIIIPCYNQAQYLEEALYSVLNQSYDNWECIIVNDGSTDNTEVIAKKWQLKDERFKYLYQSNSGVSSARNLGLNNCSGKFVQFLDSDDYIDSNKLEASISSINDGFDLVITNFKTFINDVKLAKAHPGFLNPLFFNFTSVLYQWGLNFNIPIHCGFFPIDFFQEFKFSRELKGNEDWMMWLHFFKKNPSVCFLEQVMVYYRSNVDSVTQNDIIMNDSYNKAIVNIREIITSEEYIDFLTFLVLKKNESIIELRHKIFKYQNATAYKTLNRIKNNKLGKALLKYVLKLLKK